MNLFNNKHNTTSGSRFAVGSFPDGLDLQFSDQEEFQRILSGMVVSRQFICLSELAARGYAETIRNGFFIPSEHAARLDDELREALSLPPRFTGSINASFKGVSHQPESFDCSVSLRLSSGEKVSSYKLIGPLLQISHAEQFLLDEIQFQVFSGIGAFRDRKSNRGTNEFDNLHLIRLLQDAQGKGAALTLDQFEHLTIREPEKVSVKGEIDSEQNLLLTPHFPGTEATSQDIAERLGQIEGKTSCTTLRVKGEIILLREPQEQAVREIVRSKRIPKRLVPQFLKDPAAFIDPNLVDLEAGFSVRVHGVVPYQHLYFGVEAQTAIDWYGKNPGAHVEQPIPLAPSHLKGKISNSEDLESILQRISDAWKAGATSIPFDGDLIDISDQAQTKKVVEDIRERILSQSGGSQPEKERIEETEPKESAVVCIETNAEIVGTDYTPPNFKLWDETKLSWAGYKRKPLDHQVSGVRWFLGLYGNAPGAILADDMGLGKTFTLLAGIQHSLQLIGDQEAKPVLVVAPLSLLENWQAEVEKSFETSPFSDIILLVGQELQKYRREGYGQEITQQDFKDRSLIEARDVRYSLKVRSTCDAGEQEYLDMPKRLVITTYETLRNYQFSLCLVEWSTVVFDEAQYIKNPNSLQSIAAKGLKAKLKICSTGTPVENSLVDIWNLCDTVVPGHLGSFAEFRTGIMKPYAEASTPEAKAVIGKELRSRIGALMLRRLKDDILEGLPAKKLHSGISSSTFDSRHEYHPKMHGIMAGLQLRAYNGALSYYHGAAQKRAAALSTLHALRNISLHPMLAQENTCQQTVAACDSVKLESTIAILHEIESRNEKAIVFLINKRLQLAVAEILQKEFLIPVSIINGDTSTRSGSEKSRLSQIRAFESRKGFACIVMSPIAAGVGLTIVEANNVIHLERHWNPAKEAQATDRVYRIGQKNQVNVYYPIAHHPDSTIQAFDVLIHQLLSRKVQLQDAIVAQEDVLPIDALEREGASGSDLIQAEDIRRITGNQLEFLVAEWCKHRFPEADISLTSKSDDHGIDIICRFSPTEISIVQCKSTTAQELQSELGIDDLDRGQVHAKNSMKCSVRDYFLATNAKSVSGKLNKTLRSRGYQLVAFPDLCQWVSGSKVSFSALMKWEVSERCKV